MSESAAPPFVFSRESKIRIDAEGRFWHEGALVEHPGLSRALASWIAVDAATGRYVLRNTMDWCFITVDDVPLVVRSVTIPERGPVLAWLSDGTTEPLDPATLRLGEGDALYCDVKNGGLPARFGRAAAFALLDRARPEGQGYVLELPSGEQRIDRRAGAHARSGTRAP
jgi:hypothetical protein